LHRFKDGKEYKKDESIEKLLLRGSAIATNKNKRLVFVGRRVAKGIRVKRESSNEECSTYCR